MLPSTIPSGLSAKLPRLVRLNIREPRPIDRSSGKKHEEALGVDFGDLRQCVQFSTDQAEEVHFNMEFIESIL